MKGLFKHIGLFCFIALMAFQLLHKTAYALYFICNQTAIAEAHCVNKERPEVKCDGRCHLKKYLAQQTAEEEEKNSTPQSFWQDLEEQPLQFCESFAAFSLEYYVWGIVRNSGTFPLVFWTGFDYQSTIFHPPTT